MFNAGQAFGVIPEWEHSIEYNDTQIASTDRKLRLYSIASPSAGEQGDGKLISTPVKRVFDEHRDDHTTFLGACSNYLCDLQVGDPVKITGPTGRHFLLPDREDRDGYNYVFLATGTGIAPFRGMLMELLDQAVDCRVDLILGVPYFTDVLYRDYFRQMDEQHDHFRFMEAVSRQQETEDGRKMYVQERMLEQEDRFESLLNDENTLVYICGMKGMETGIYKVLLQLGAEELLSTVPDSIRDLDLDKASGREDPFSKVRPNKDRVKVEVY
jgi:ferredoxin--NADP+ reductase